MRNAALRRFGVGVNAARSMAIEDERRRRRWRRQDEFLKRAPRSLSTNANDSSRRRCLTCDADNGGGGPRLRRPVARSVFVREEAPTTAAVGAISS